MDRCPAPVPLQQALLMFKLMNEKIITAGIFVKNFIDERKKERPPAN